MRKSTTLDNEFSSVGTKAATSHTNHFNIKTPDVKPDIRFQTEEIDISDDDEDEVEANPIIEAQVKAAELGVILPQARRAKLLKKLPEHL